MGFVATLVLLFVRATGILHAPSRGNGSPARLKCSIIPLLSSLSLDAFHDRSSFLSLPAKTRKFSYVLETWMCSVSYLQLGARSDV